MKCLAPSPAVALAALLITLGGCRDSPVEPPTYRPALRATWIRPTTPTAIHGAPSSSVTAPEVVVFDQRGNPVANVPVRFAVVSGGGALANGIVATDSAGQAAAGHWMLGPELGENLVVAEVEGLTPAAFVGIGGLEPVNTVYALTMVNDQSLPVPGGSIAGYLILYEDRTFKHGRVFGGGDRPIASGLEVGEYSRGDSVITFHPERGAAWSGFLQDNRMLVQDFDLRGLEVYTVMPSAPSTAPVAAIYDRISPSFIPGTHRYVLYEDLRYALQYVRPDRGFFEYPGRYSRADSVMTFDFDGRSVAGPWRADGIIRGDSLIIRYNDLMLHSAFDDGVDVRAPGDAAGDAHIRAHFHIATVFGSGITRLTRGRWPTWSPDGERIAFARGGDVYGSASRSRTRAARRLDRIKEIRRCRRCRVHGAAAAANFGQRR